ncbi:hypothetical protein FOZ62_009698, partial [Perkinsus olseni]
DRAVPCYLSPSGSILPAESQQMATAIDPFARYVLVNSEKDFGLSSIPDGHDGSFPAATFLDPRYLPCVSRSCRATCYISPQSGACVPRAIEGSEGYGILLEFCSSCNSQTQCNDALQSTPALPVKYTSKCDWSLDSCSSLCRASLKHNPVYWALPNTVWDV